MDSSGIISIKYFRTSVGELILGSFMEKICLCDWKHRRRRSQVDERIQEYLSARYHQSESEVLELAAVQLEEYFLGERKSFDLPLVLSGSEFQRRVWEQLQKIAYGETMTYLDLARSIGNEKAIRAVASANGANALSIIVPCHRVVGSKGELTGYAGGLAAKRFLLRLEGGKEKYTQLELFPA